MGRKRNNSGAYKICMKCGKEEKDAYIEWHHFLPKKWFYGNGDGVYLCTKCHREYHSRNREQYSTDRKERAWYYRDFVKWLIGLAVIYFIVKMLI